MTPLESINQKLQGEIDPGFAGRAGFIADTVAQIKPKTILDVGCGRGFYLKLLSAFPFIKGLTGVEIRADYADKASLLNKDDKRVSVITGSIYKLPFTSNSFDLIVCSEVLEHLKDDQAGLKELRRVLKPQGTLIVTVPNQNFPFLWDPLNSLLMKFGTHIPAHIWWLAGIWADHIRLYTPGQIESLLTQNGFKIDQKQEFIHWCWPLSHFILYGIGKNIVEYFGAGQVNRFSFTPPGKLALRLGQLMRFPERLQNIFPARNSMNIAILAKKSS